MEPEGTLSEFLENALRTKFAPKRWASKDDRSVGMLYHKNIYVPLELTREYTEGFFAILIDNLTGGVTGERYFSYAENCVHYIVRFDDDPGEDKNYILKFRTGVDGIAFKLVKIEK